MKKYILKESELKDLILNMIMEEFTAANASTNQNETNWYTSEDFQPDPNWENAVKQMANFYANNIHTYQMSPWGRKGTGNRKLYSYGVNEKGEKVPTPDGLPVGDDCSEFVKHCLILSGIPLNGVHVTTATMQPGGDFNKILLSNGFVRLPYSPKTVKPFDIICGGPKTHTEIYAGDGRSYSWGAIHDTKHGGLPCRTATTKFIHIWRYIGHGNKPRSYMDNTYESLSNSQNNNIKGTINVANNQQQQQNKLTGINQYPNYGS